MKATAGLVVCIWLAVITLSCTRPSSPTEALADSTALKTAKAAFLYGLPLVIMDVTRRQMIDGSNPEGSAENTFRHHSKFPDATFRDVVRPNADTYYSAGILNLKAEPMVLSLPDTKGRYYMMPMLDAYTNIFASPGSRTTGTKAGDFLITGPQWNGEVPAHMTEIKAPTNFIWIIGRTQVNSKEDGDKIVVPLQQQYKLVPLSAWGQDYSPPAAVADPSVPKGNPNDVVTQMPIEDYFNYLNRLLSEYPPPAADSSALKHFALIGVGPDRKFNLSSFGPDAQDTLHAMPEVITMFRRQMTTRSDETGWIPVGSIVGTYGTNYYERAFISVVGLGANLPADAIYPSTAVDADGNVLNGSNNYVLRFEKGQTPPANAFWSVTVYDNEGYFTANPINRYAIGDRSNLKVGKDGATEIYIQQTSPGKDRQSNWLPSPNGDFNIVMRVYWPKDEAINGSWKLTPIRKATKQ
jgi:hypothetical protein